MSDHIVREVDAQADYEARILAALVPPAPGAEKLGTEQFRQLAMVACQIEIDRGDRNANWAYAVGARASRDAIIEALKLAGSPPASTATGDAT